MIVIIWFLKSNINYIITSGTIPPKEKLYDIDTVILISQHFLEISLIT